MKAFTILVVDDDADMRLYLRGCLRGPDESRGVDTIGETLREDPVAVLEAASGEQALETLAAHRVDLVISDVVLPGVDGEALLRLIRSDPKLNLLPVLLISGQEQAGCHDDPTAGWLSKPFNARQLLAAVKPLLEQRR